MIYGLNITHQTILKLHESDTKIHLTGSRFFWNRIGRPWDFLTKDRIKIEGFNKIYNRNVAHPYLHLDFDDSIMKIWHNKGAKIYIYQIHRAKFGDKLIIQQFLQRKRSEFQTLLKTHSHKFIWEKMFAHMDDLDGVWCILNKGNNDELAAL